MAESRSNFFGQPARGDEYAGRFLRLLDWSVALRGGSEQQSPTVIRAHYDDWTEEQHLIVLGAMAECGSARGIIFVTGEIPLECFHRGEASDGFLLCSPEGADGDCVSVARLVPDNDWTAKNDQVLTNVVRHVLA